MSDKKKRSFYNECRALLDGDFMQKNICLVCFEHVFDADSSVFDVDDQTANRLASRLSVNEELSSSLRLYYDVSDIFPCLKNTLLSRRSLLKCENDSGLISYKVRICKKCQIR